MIQDRIRSLCDRNGISLKMACQSSGVAYGTLHAQLKKGREVPFSTMDRLAHFFEVPLEYFSHHRPTMSVMADRSQPPARQKVATAYSTALQSAQMDLMRKGFGLGTEQILDWLASEGGVLTNFDAIRDRVDLFHPVEATDSMMRPQHIGRNSLVSIQLGLENEAQYTDVVGRFDRSLIDRVLDAHTRVSEMPYLVSDEAIEVVFGDQRIKHCYRRVVARVRDTSGTEFTLVHAKPI